MQPVGGQNNLGMSGKKSGHRPKAVYQRKTMRPAEVRLEMQVLLGGLLVSGVLLMLINTLGL